jgi:hypothetical protein
VDQIRTVSRQLLAKRPDKPIGKIEKYNYKSGNLLIRVATSAEEIIREGAIQKHCVGSYVWKIASGASAIMLIRKVSSPNKPFYTLELKNDKSLDVLQCRGKLNTGTTPEVKAFIEKWQEHIKQPEKSKRINKSQMQEQIAV